MAVPIGERLTARGAVAPEAIEEALAEQRRTGSRLGEILLATGELRADNLAPLLAEQWGLPWLDDGVALAPEALPPELAWRLAVVPVRIGGTVRFATSELLHPTQRDELRAVAGHADLIVTTPQRVMELTTAAYRGPGIERATDHLRTQRPEMSASRVLTRGQKIALAVGAAMLAAAFALWPLGTAATVLAAITTYYLVNSLYKFKLAFDSLSGAGTIDVTDEEVAAVDERTLPLYTILVPLYKEAGDRPAPGRATSTRSTTRATKLDVKLLCEEDDDETIDGDPRRRSCRRTSTSSSSPTASPKTKPQGVQLRPAARDAAQLLRDLRRRGPARPRPAQEGRHRVRPSRATTSSASRRKLNYFNQDQNLLTRWFATEYSMWFDLVLPGLGAADVADPARRHLEPLHHRDAARARRLGPVQRHRGRRPRHPALHREGYRDRDDRLDDARGGQLAASGNWIRQRSRWIKGYIQTWLVHMRHPFAAAARRSASRPSCRFRLTSAASFVLLLNPIFWGLTTLFVLTQAGVHRAAVPGLVFYVAAR